MKHAWTILCWLVIALGIILALGALPGCTRKPPALPPPHLPTEEPHDFGEGSATEYVQALENRTFPGMETSPRFPTVYFDYDSDALRPEFRAPLEAAVKDSRARWACYVDGHASEEGSAEYNLALGDRRAATVATYLELLGGISTVSTSYGEERPVAHLPEEQWRNRRVEVKCR